MKLAEGGCELRHTSTFMIGSRITGAAFSYPCLREGRDGGSQVSAGAAQPLPDCIMSRRQARNIAWAVERRAGPSLEGKHGCKLEGQLAGVHSVRSAVGQHDADALVAVGPRTNKGVRCR